MNKKNTNKVKFEQDESSEDEIKAIKESGVLDLDDHKTLKNSLKLTSSKLSEKEQAKAVKKGLDGRERTRILAVL